MKAFTIRGHKVTEGIRLEGREPYLFLGQVPPSLGWPNDGYFKVPILPGEEPAVVRYVPEKMQINGQDQTVHVPFTFEANVVLTGAEPQGETANFAFTRVRDANGVLAHILVDRVDRENTIRWNDKVDVYGCLRNEHKVGLGMAGSTHQTDARLLVKIRLGGKISVPLTGPAGHSQGRVLKISFDGQKINARRFRTKSFEVKQ